VREVASSNLAVPTIFVICESKSPPLMTTSEYSKLFRLLHGYAKRHHKCFLAELFLCGKGDEYIMCFRPTTTPDDAENRWACQYARIETVEARELRRTGLLTVSIANILDEKLQPLTQM
jgi:hypothetical protein